MSNPQKVVRTYDEQSARDARFAKFDADGYSGR